MSGAWPRARATPALCGGPRCQATDLLGACQRREGSRGRDKRQVTQAQRLHWAATRPHATRDPRSMARAAAMGAPQQQRGITRALLAVLLLCSGCHAAPAHPWNAVKLGLAADGDGRDSQLYVPRTYRRNTPSPLLVMLHAAGKGAADALALLDGVQPLLDKQRCLVLLPQSKDPTWDLVARGAFGPDVAGLRSSLQWVFRRYTIDKHRIALAGFSDGATYALSAGLPLGTLFSHLIAWSPGGLAPPLVQGRPKVAVFHGTADKLFPIDKTSRAIVPQLAQLLPPGSVVYAEHAGAHEAPAAVVQAGIEWWLLGKQPPAAKVVGAHAARAAGQRGRATAVTSSHERCMRPRSLAQRALTSAPHARQRPPTFERWRSCWEAAPRQALAATWPRGAARARAPCLRLLPPRPALAGWTRWRRPARASLNPSS